MPQDNPFQPPAARIVDLSDTSSRTLVAPQRRPAGHGWCWIRDGFGLFSRAPLTWVMLILLFLAVSFLLSLVPVVSLLNFPLSILFAGGVMLGCAALDRGESLSLKHLFAGLQTGTAALLGLGGIYLGAAVLVMMVVGAAGMMFEQELGAFLLLATQPGAVVSPDQLQPALLILSGLLLLGWLLLSPVLMAIWFAPALIVLHEKPALEAATLSLQACLKNWLPFTVYGLIATLLIILGTLPLGLGLLVVIPVLTASVYTGYKDIFLE